MHDLHTIAARNAEPTDLSIGVFNEEYDEFHILATVSGECFNTRNKDRQEAMAKAMAEVFKMHLQCDKVHVLRREDVESYVNVDYNDEQILFEV